MEAGWNEDAHHIGAINRVKIREVNGFMYYQMNTVESDQELRERFGIAENYWVEKRFLAALRFWDDIIKPLSIKNLTALQDIRLDSLSTEELMSHLIHCHEVTRQMVFNHHRFTYTSFVPVGDFIRQVRDWTGKEPIDVLCLLRGSDTNRLLFSRELSQAEEFMDSLRNSPDALQLLAKVDNEPESADKLLAKLADIGDDIERGLQSLIEYCGYRIVSGYDITCETFTERPDLLLKSLKSLLSHRIYECRTASEDEIKGIRDLVPAEARPVFDEMFSDARRMERLRDERGMFSDLWAVGILRCAFLEAGKRIANVGLIEKPDLALDATLEELVSFLLGTPIITSKELQQRAQYRMCYSVTDVPSILEGFPTQPLKMPDLPHSLSRIMNGLNIAISLAVEHTPNHTILPDKMVGISASMGVVEGSAKVIISEDQIKEIKMGDILVVHQTTAAFTIVFPLIAGIISEYGGILSHPAILAREYGIPCIVGCLGATGKIHTGMRIRLDGTKGIVQVV